MRQSIYKNKELEKMIKLKEVKAELIEELKEIAEEFKYMSIYARTEETTKIMNELKQALIETTDSVLEYNLIEFNNNWQWLKYALVDLENAINEEQNETEKRGRKSPSLNKLNKSFMDVYTFQVWNIDRLTNQPVIS